MYFLTQLTYIDVFGFFCYFSPSRYVFTHHEEAREAAVQPHLPAGLLATTQHFFSASSPRPNRCGTQWWVTAAWTQTKKKGWFKLFLPHRCSFCLKPLLSSLCSRSYIDEEPPSSLAPAVFGLGHLAPGAVALLLAHHHPLPASPQPRWSPQELRAVVRPVQPAEQPGQPSSFPF